MNTSDNNSTPQDSGVGSGALFDRCVRFRRYADGYIECSCVLGLWSVSASTREQAEREAKHYWIQYYTDGEYDRHLSNGKDQPRGNP